MNVLNMLWRNMKWHLKNPIIIIMIAVQPLIWLLLYSTVASQTMGSIEGGNYTAFMLPGILVLVTLASCGSIGMMNYITKASGSFYRIQIAPIRRSAIVVGQILENVLLAFVEAAILFIISLFMSVRIASGFTGIIIMIFLLSLTAFFMSGISYTLSLNLPNEEVFQTVMNTIVLPIFFVSTALFPLSKISGGLRAAVLMNPFTYIINSIRSLIFDAAIQWNDIFFTTGLFLILCLLSFILSVWSLKKDGKQ